MLQCGSPKDTGPERVSHPDSASSLLCDPGKFPFLGGKRRVLDEVSKLWTTMDLLYCFYLHERCFERFDLPFP